jgi:hypothetical protein
MLPVFSAELRQGKAGYRRAESIAAWRTAMAIALFAASVLAQPKPEQPPVPAIEFPVIMQQKVAAGKTPVGTEVHAKLVIATLVKGTVIPEGALFSGEVTESVAKSGTMPSRLGVRMDSARWKSGSVPMRVYLSAWYYPVAMSNEDAMSAAADGPILRNSRSVPRPGNPTALPQENASSLPGFTISQRRVLMKDVEPIRESEGAVSLTSNRTNLKLDKATTYVLAADGLVPTK